MNNPSLQSRRCLAGLERRGNVDDSSMLFLDPLQQQTIMAVKTFPRPLALSLDVGLSEQAVTLHPAQLLLETGEAIILPDFSGRDAREGRTILVLREDEWQKWQYYDPGEQRFYKMVFVAYQKPPTVEIGGIKMHVTMDGDPEIDTRHKIRALGKVRGNMLDTCCGLGYTAQALARIRSVRKVITLERDAAMVQLCRENPWSHPVWQSDKITCLHQNSAEFITQCGSAFFNAILHDPPRYALAPELYEVAFYRECLRVLNGKGKMYHYTGNPNKSRRISLAEKTIERLLEAGFRKARPAYQGVCAWK